DQPRHYKKIMLRVERLNLKLESKAIQTLPEAIQPKLEKFADQGFLKESDFEAALAKILTPEELKQHQAAIKKKATSKKDLEEIEIPVGVDPSWPLEDRGWILAGDTRRVTASNPAEAIYLGF